MAKPASLALDRGSRALYWAEQAAIVISASLFVALCAHVTVPLPFTPVPLTLQNLGCFWSALPWEAVAALPRWRSTWWKERRACRCSIPRGWAVSRSCQVRPRLPAGLSVCRWAGGLDMERGKASFARAATAGVLAEVVLFAGGLSWLTVLTHSFARQHASAFTGSCCGSDQGHVGRWSLNRMAACPQGAGMSFVETPSGTTALAPETKIRRAESRPRVRSASHTVPTPMTPSCSTLWPPIRCASPGCALLISFATLKP